MYGYERFLNFFLVNYLNVQRFQNSKLCSCQLITVCLGPYNQTHIARLSLRTSPTCLYTLLLIQTQMANPFLLS